VEDEVAHGNATMLLGKIGTAIRKDITVSTSVLH
jgi:hypothetical protein